MILKCCLFPIFCLLFILPAIAQEEPREVTPAIMAKLSADIERQVPALRRKLIAQSLTDEAIEFALDTFRINQLVHKRIDIDYSTYGMNQAVGDQAKAYDVLLNKYYKKLLNELQPEDRKTLITAQKAWLAFREAEKMLIWTLCNEKYGIGGTIASSISIGSISDLLIHRTIEIFNHYNSVHPR